MMMYDGIGASNRDFDSVASVIERCGNHVLQYDVSNVCLHKSACRCVPRGIYAGLND
jgi:hypothetical protein